MQLGLHALDIPAQDISEHSLQQSLLSTERTFVNHGATKILDFEKIKKSRASRNKKLRAFLDQNDYESD